MSKPSSLLPAVGLLAGLLALASPPAISWQLPESSGAPKVGDKAPDFTLPDAEGRPVQLSGLLAPAKEGAPGSWVLLIFYRGYW